MRLTNVALAAACIRSPRAPPATWLPDTRALHIVQQTLQQLLAEGFSEWLPTVFNNYEEIRREKRSNAGQSLA